MIQNKFISMKIFFNMVPIGISSIITCSAAIIKFKKYQDKMEHMQFTREKVILSISKSINLDLNTFIALSLFLC